MRSSLVFGVLLAASGCTHVPKTGEAVADVCRVEQNGRTATASGYLQAPILIGCHEKDCALQLTAERRAHYGMTVRVPLGTGPGTMTPLKRPKETAIAFTAERVTLDLRDSNGRALGVRDVVRVTGPVEAYVSGGELRCEMRAVKLEKL